MGIGWIMFWKAVVVSLWAAFVIRWKAFKAKRSLNLRLDKKTGVYVPDNRIDRFERIFLRVFWVFLAVGTLSVYFVFTMAYLFPS